MCKHIRNCEKSGVTAILLGGPPASGKGTQARNLGGVHISSGDLARKRRAVDIEFDDKYGHVMDGGNYLPDEVVFELIQGIIPEIQNRRGRVIWDGTFRNCKQAIRVGSLISRPNLAISFHIIISWEVTLKRARDRYIKEKRTDDANEEGLLVRYTEWVRYDKLVQAKLRKQGVTVYEIDGNRTEEEVTAEIQTLLKKHETKIQKMAERHKPPGSSRVNVSMLRNQSDRLPKPARKGTRQKKRASVSE